MLARRPVRGCRCCVLPGAQRRGGERPLQRRRAWRRVGRARRRGARKVIRHRPARHPRVVCVVRKRAGAARRVPAVRVWPREGARRRTPVVPCRMARGGACARVARRVARVFRPGVQRVPGGEWRTVAGGGGAALVRGAFGQPARGAEGRKMEVRARAGVGCVERRVCRAWLGSVWVAAVAVRAVVAHAGQVRGALGQRRGERAVGATRRLRRWIAGVHVARSPVQHGRAGPRGGWAVGRGAKDAHVAQRAEHGAARGRGERHALGAAHVACAGSMGRCGGSSTGAGCIVLLPLVVGVGLAAVFLVRMR